MVAIYIFIFIFGLMLGSFINVLIYRIPQGKSIVLPPSSCPACGSRLKPQDLIPVFSWIFLKGKCRYCSKPVSPRYMVVELLTALSITGLYYRFGLSLAFFAFMYLTVLLVAVMFIDFDLRIIPDELVIAGLIGGGILFIYNAFIPGQFIFGDSNWWTPLLGMVSGSGILLTVATIGFFIYKDDAMGMGDVKLLAPIGIFLGWKLCLTGLFIAIIISGVISLFLIILRLKKRKDAIPFGPFIVIGTYLSILWGWDIINWYFGML